jgi:hypothetical protein
MRGTSLSMNCLTSVSSHACPVAEDDQMRLRFLLLCSYLIGPTGRLNGVFIVAKAV